MGLDDIRKKIIADAEAKKAEALKAAQKQADAVIAGGEKEASEYSAEYDKASRNIAENIERGLVIDARRTLSNGILAKKRERIGLVYKKAMADFLKSAEYPKLLQELVVKSLQSKKEQVIVSKGDKALDDAWLASVNKAASAQLTFAKENGAFSGGVILRDGETYVNITADVLFGLIREKTEKPVADILFGA